MNVKVNKGFESFKARQKCSKILTPRNNDACVNKLILYIYEKARKKNIFGSIFKLCYSKNFDFIALYW
jgi:hypothetical protein